MNAKSRIGFIGIGMMGKPMATRILKAGYPLTVYDIRPEPVQEFVKAGAPASSYFQTLGASMLAGYHWSGNVASLLAFSLGALMYYYIFYQTRLVPRWLSGWGLVAAALCMVAGVLVMFSLIGPLSTPQVVLALPIAVQEMVLAVWLIVKGFNPSVVASELR